MTTERDLQEALEPLAGDPRATADRVLAALPAPRPTFPYWLAAGLVGLALGLLGGRHLWKGETEVVVSEVEVSAAPVSEVEVPVASAAAVRTVVGRVARRTPDGESNDLHVTSALWFGDRIETREESLASVLLDDGTELRLNADSVVELVSASQLRLLRGQLWARLTPEKAWTIEHDAGAVETDGAIVDVQARGSWMRLTTIEGGARLRSPDGVTRLVQTGQSCAVDEGILRNREYVSYSLQVIAWQLPLLCGTPREELLALASEMVRMLGNPSGSKEAASVLRDLGPCSAPALLAALEPSLAMSFREVRRPAALLLRDVATYESGKKMFALLVDPDPQISAAIYAAIVRVTGTNRADERFWSMGDREERAREARDWQMAVYR